jgi:hypothetical protein
VDSLRKCEGYQTIQTWLFDPRARTKQSLEEKESLSQTMSPLRSIGDSNDQRSFQIWIEQGAPIFSFYFGHSFWTSLLPAIGMSQPAVKHMLLTTAAVVETATLGGAPLAENKFYQSHYTKAIEATVSSSHTANVLLACLMFASCEFMQGSIASGLYHVNAGLNIIGEWYVSPQSSTLKNSKEAKLIIDAIGPIFLAYIDKAPTYGFGDVTTIATKCTDVINLNFELPCIGSFTAIHHAEHALDGIGHHVARLMDWIRKPYQVSSAQQIQALLADWHTSFDRFEATMMRTANKQHTLPMQLLRVHSVMMSIMLRCMTTPNEAQYEQYSEEFKWVLDKYDSFFKLWAQDETVKFFGRNGRSHYQLGYIPPLFFTAVKCRDPTVQSTALKHLARLKVVENNWSSCVAYAIAKKTIELEQARKSKHGPPGRVHEKDRIRPVEVSIADQKQTKAVLDYTSYPYEEESSLADRESFELPRCSSVRLVVWPLSRIVRIGGYQGGAVKPTPTNCSCLDDPEPEQVVSIQTAKR